MLDYGDAEFCYNHQKYVVESSVNMEENERIICFDDNYYHSAIDSLRKPKINGENFNHIADQIEDITWITER